jgi:hypothetical protein
LEDLEGDWGVVLIVGFTSIDYKVGRWMVLTQDRANGGLWYQLYEPIGSATKDSLAKPSTRSPCGRRVILQRDSQSSTPREYIILYISTSTEL